MPTTSWAVQRNGETTLHCGYRIVRTRKKKKLRKKYKIIYVYYYVLRWMWCDPTLCALMWGYASSVRLWHKSYQVQQQFFFFFFSAPRGVCGGDRIFIVYAIQIPGHPRSTGIFPQKTKFKAFRSRRSTTSRSKLRFSKNYRRICTTVGRVQTTQKMQFGYKRLKKYLKQFYLKQTEKRNEKRD